MDIKVHKRLSKDKQKIYYTFEWGKEEGQRQATGIFTHAKPKDQLQRNHNKEALAIIITKQSELILERQAIGSGHVPIHKFKANFLDYYAEFVAKNRRVGNRHLTGSLCHFKAFLRRDFLAPVDVTEELCRRYRQYLLDRFTGDTPANYFARFKRCMKAAAKEGYFRISPAEDVQAKSNSSKYLKEILERDEYFKLLATPCSNQNVREAFIFSCYTGLRLVDVKNLEWSQIKDGEVTTRIIQKKTGRPLVITLHPVARSILEKRSANNIGANTSNKVFRLCTTNGCNKVLGKWVLSAGINKHITWHCARHSFSVLLQDANVDNATVSLLLGQTSTKYVDRTYRRHRLKDHSDVLKRLPDGLGLWKRATN
jgi:integrase